jgi:hypothetical protein
MNTEQFQDLLDRHGADFDRWPYGERTQAEQLIADSAKARAILKQAQRFDATLSQLIARQDADDAAVMRVVARLNARPLPRQKVSLWRLPAMLLNVQFTPAWPRVTALCACAVIGFFVGISGIDRRIDALDQGDQIDGPFLSAGSGDLGSVFGSDPQNEARP